MADDSASPGRVWGPWATIGFGLVTGVVSFVVQVISVIIVAAVIYATNLGLTQEELFRELMTVNGFSVSVASIASALVGGGLLIIVVAVRKGISTAEYLGLKKISRRAIFNSLAVIAVIIVVSDLTSYVLGRQINAGFMVDIYTTSLYPVLLWLAIVVFAPLFEESFFRGFMFAGFINTRLGVIGTVLLTSLIWTLLHIVQYGIFELTILFISGIVLGVVRYRTGSLWAPLVMHSFMNAVAMIEVAINLNSLIG